MPTQGQRTVLQLKGRISELEAELAEQQHLRQQAADDSEFLRAELDELKKQREDTEKAQRSLTEIEREGLQGWVWGPSGGCRAIGWSQDPMALGTAICCHQQEAVPMGWVGV